MGGVVVFGNYFDRFDCEGFGVVLREYGDYDVVDNI